MFSKPLPAQPLGDTIIVRNAVQAAVPVYNPRSRMNGRGWRKTGDGCIAPTRISSSARRAAKPLCFSDYVLNGVSQELVPKTPTGMRIYFTDYTLTGQSSRYAEIPRYIECHKSGHELVRDSLRRGRCEIDSFPDTLPGFPEPRSWIGAVNHAPQKAQPLGCIIAVSPDVVLRDLGVQSEKGIHASGFGEDVSRVAKLWGFYDDGFLNVENVFLPKQIDPACPACELAIEEWVIIGTPADLGDIKVTRNAQFGTHSLQLHSLDRPMLQAQPDLIQSLRVLAKAMIGSFGRFD